LVDKGPRDYTILLAQSEISAIKPCAGGRIEILVFGLQ